MVIFSYGVSICGVQTLINFFISEISESESNSAMFFMPSMALYCIPRETNYNFLSLHRILLLSFQTPILIQFFFKINLKA